jgi:hypothetical protein
LDIAFANRGPAIDSAPHRLHTLEVEVALGSFRHAGSGAKKSQRFAFFGGRGRLICFHFDYGINCVLLQVLSRIRGSWFGKAHP